MLSPFVSPGQVAELQAGGADVRFADCRWYLDGRSGREAYRAGHLPGAVFIDLDVDLAGPVGTGTGRHPLPSPDAFAAAMSRLGIGDSTTVIGYDDAGGVIAARLIWMLRTLGVDAALLDGGLAAWPAELCADDVQPEPVRFTIRDWPSDLLADLTEVADVSSAALVLDARPAERFRGEGDDVDPRSGHIPGAVNVPCRENVGADGRLLDLQSLQERFAAAGVIRQRVTSGEVISSCGSGVTACHNLLAMEWAGLGRARLYPGSWSQYAATDLPIEIGDGGQSHINATRWPDLARSGQVARPGTAEVPR